MKVPGMAAELARILSGQIPGGNRPSILLFFLLFSGIAHAQEWKPLKPLLRTVDLDVGEAVQVELHDGSKAEVELLRVEPVVDPVFDAVREVKVHIKINGEEKTVYSGNYRLPVTVGGVQVDCPVTG